MPFDAAKGGGLTFSEAALPLISRLQGTWQWYYIRFPFLTESNETNFTCPEKNPKRDLKTKRKKERTVMMIKVQFPFCKTGK